MTDTHSEEFSTPSVTKHAAFWIHGKIPVKQQSKVSDEIQDWVGHDSIVETMDTYGHLFPNHLAMVGHEIDKIFDNVMTDTEKNYTTVA